MKKISLLAMLMIGCSTVLLAQNTPVFGIKAGLNVSDLKVENTNSDVRESLLGFHAGLLSHIHISNKIAFQPEVQFSGQGAEIAGSDVKWKLNYINVPLMFQYMFNNGFRIEAGPYVGFLMSAKDEGRTGATVDVKDEYETLDAGLGFGLNYLTYSGFGVGGRYNLGLKNVADLSARANALEQHNRVFQISVFYMFDNDHKRKSR